jgi:cyclopropane fatty-acyl-phospholipid synthase-like methyltransferase
VKDKDLYQIISGKLDGAENILDIGCGEGGLCNYLAKNTKKKITGLDVSGIRARLSFLFSQEID